MNAKLLLIPFAVASLLCSCSKKAPAATPAAATEASTEAPPAEKPADDGGYDAKVAAALQVTSGVPLTEAQIEAGRRAEKQLLDAVEKDPKAAEAYKNLQRLRNGR